MVAVQLGPRWRCVKHPVTQAETGLVQESLLTLAFWSWLYFLTT